MNRFAALTVLPIVSLLTACSPSPPAGPVPVSQAAVDGYQDKRLDELEARVEALERELRAARPTLGAPAGTSVTLPPAPSPEEPDTRAAPPQPDAIEFLELSTKPTESNNSWTRYSWRAVVRNNLRQPMPVKVIVQFLDAEGFVLDEATEYVTLGAGEVRTFSDFELVDAAVAPRVAKAAGRIER